MVTAPRPGRWRRSTAGLSCGNFLNAANCSEAIALAGAAMRYSGKILKAGTCAPLLLWDKENMKFTNVHDANQS